MDNLTSWYYFNTTDKETKDKREQEKEDLIKATCQKTSDEKFSPKDLLPRGGGSHSIQEILADIVEVILRVIAVRIYLVLGVTHSFQFFRALFNK